MKFSRNELYIILYRSAFRALTSISLAFGSLHVSHGIRRMFRFVCVLRNVNIPPAASSRIALLKAYVEMVRFELMTPCLQGRCSPN